MEISIRIKSGSLAELLVILDFIRLSAAAGFEYGNWDDGATTYKWRLEGSPDNLPAGDLRNHGEGKPAPSADPLYERDKNDALREDANDRRLEECPQCDEKLQDNHCTPCEQRGQ
jgi:hypothetical protein